MKHCGGKGKKRVAGDKKKSGDPCWPGFDHGRNHVPGVHDPGALGRKYSLVAASNVLNTLPSRSAVQSTINQIAQVTQPGGEAIVNYPGSPRKAGLPDAEVEEMLRKRFRGLQKLQSGVYRCTK